MTLTDRRARQSGLRRSVDHIDPVAVRIVVASVIAIVPLVLRGSHDPLGLRIATAGLAGTLVALLVRNRTPLAPVLGAASASLVGIALVRPSIALLVGLHLAAASVAVATAGWIRRPSLAPGRITAGLGLVLSSAVVVTSPRLVLPLALATLGLAAVPALTLAPSPAHHRTVEGFAAVRRAVARTPEQITAWSRDPGDPTGRTMTPAGWALVAVATLLGLVVAWRSLPPILTDDAAIIFRYVERIAGGDGFTYNDGDRTSGVSAPLYALVLVTLRLFGVSPVTGAEVVGIVSFGATVGLVTYLGTRFRGLLTGAIAAGLLLTSVDFRFQALSGLEVGLAGALALGALAFVIADRHVPAGILLGLAVVNKLDAGLLALAIVAALLLARRPFPWRMAATSTIVAAPWFAFSLLYFGTPVPNSATAKLGGIENLDVSHDPRWIVEALHRDGATPILVLSAILLAGLLAIRSRRPVEIAFTALLLWGGAHLAAYSLIDLGDEYPWYRTVLYPAIALGAAGALAVGTRVALRRQGATQAVALVLVVGAAAAVVSERETPARWLRAEVQLGRTTHPFELFEQTRRDAGRFVAEHGTPGEVIATCWGWVAFEALDHPIFETCPLNTREEVGFPTWVVESSWPAVSDPQWQSEFEQAGFEVVGEFESHGDPAGVTWVFRAPTRRGTDP